MPYDYSKLKGLIVEKYQTQTQFAHAMGLSERSISLKLNRKVGWTQAEISKACKLLSIDSEHIAAYFFARRLK